MNKKTLTALIVAVAMIHAASLPDGARAQETTNAGGAVSINNQAGRVQIKLERGSHVAISNRFGRITITGWDRDTVEATATSDKGAEAVQVEMTADPTASHSLLTLNVPGRPGQRGAFPYVYVNPETLINPRIYNAYPNPPNNPKPNAAPQVQGATPTPKAAPAKPVKASPPTGSNNSNVIIVPMPDMSEVPVPNVSIAPDAVIMAPPAQPRQPAPATAKSGVRGAVSGASGGVGIGGAYATSGSSISLNVKMPRYAKLETIEVRSGDVNISDIDGPVSISGGSSNNITVSRVGALEVRTRAGNINVDGVEGLVYIVATSGTITVRRTKGDVRATSINGNINLHCIKGRVDASNARGGIVLGGIEGDVDASTTDADINFIGAIRPQGRYRLKSMEGRVIMSIPESSPGFTATLDSYNSDVITTFPITTETLAGGSMRVNRRIVVKQGSGDAQITLDSFGQAVHLTKLTTAANTACQ
jgi:hypothetical protein